MIVPGSASPLFLATAAAAEAAAYQIDRSLRFDSSDSYLSRTPSTAGNRKTWTWSGWVKRSGLGAQQRLFMSEISFSEIAALRFNASDQLQSYLDDDGTDGYISNTTDAVFRDVSAWYHVVWAVDSTKATASDRVKLYVNGVDQSYTGGDIPQNGSFAINSTTAHSIGIRLYNNTDDLDAYLAEVHFIDGQALDETYFGEFDDSGVWQPKEVTGVTYGTNGFHLDFSDNSSTTSGSNTGIGKDTSGNGNYYDSNGISVASGAGNDSLLDSPTNYDDGTNVGGNYCTFNPLDSSSASTTTSNGNLQATLTNNSSIRGSFYVSSGKWYYEVTVTTLKNLYLGLAANGGQPTSYSASQAFGVNNAGDIYKNGSNTGINSVALAAGSTFGIAFDADNQLFWIAKDGQWYSADDATANTINVSEVVAGTSGYDFSSLSGDKYAPNFGNSDTAGADISVNFGQRPFAYTPPTDYVSLCTQNLSESAYASIADGSTEMDVALWTGNSAARDITGFNFSPDLVWIKKRDSTSYNFGNHHLFDTVRGKTIALISNDSQDEQTESTQLTEFNSDGFSLGTSPSSNATDDTYVAWAWNAGTASAASNTDGSITSNVKANQSAGFSIVSYTADATSSQTIGHGLNAKLGLILVKDRDANAHWSVYHQSLNITSGEYLKLNQTSNVSNTSNSQYNSTESTTSVFTVGYGANTNYQTGNKYIAYCFAPVEGFSAFGSYEGNGDPNGPFVWTGFRPKFVLLKNADIGNAGYDWHMNDTERDSTNVIGSYLNANKDSKEATYSVIDFLSNGFKLRNTGASYNGSNNTHVFAAFAENPFRTARAR